MSLERFGKYDFRSDGFVRIERWSANRALEAYRSTLRSLPARLEGEPPSATMVSDATVTWSAEPADIGMKVRQRHVGRVHPEVRPLVANWVKAGKPFPSSGGFYYTIPNKSYNRVVELAKYPELRDAVLNLGLEDQWLLFWEKYLPMRQSVSEHLLSLVKTGVDPEALSRHNEEAGTGLQIRGRRLKRANLHEVAGDLDFLLPYQYAMATAFAATQIAPLAPGQVWMVECYDARIKGAIASRADTDVMAVNFDGEFLTVEAITQTRQAGSDASGALSNSYTERKLMGSSVTEQILRAYRKPRIEYPFTNRDALIYAWTLDAKPFPGKPYLIGQDFGLKEPISAGADNLFSRGFIRVGGKVMPMMLSGSSWTQAVYAVFHNYFIDKTAPGDILMALGDDMNLITASSKEDIFAPYTKVKSTDPQQNVKKVLGMFSAFSPKEDPAGMEPALVGIVPRVLKSVSSASKRGSDWAETLSNLPSAGKLELHHSDAVAESVRKDMPLLLPYMQWSGKRADLYPTLSTKWGRIPAETWDALIRHNEDIEHRMTVDDREAQIVDE